MPGGFTLDDHAGLSGPMGALFEDLRRRIHLLSPRISMSVLKSYIAFVYANHFVDVIPRKRFIRVLLLANWGMISDPDGRCKDIAGSFGPFEYEYIIEGPEDIDYAMKLIEQAFVLEQSRR